jgi:hypothetical protein
MDLLLPARLKALLDQYEASTVAFHVHDQKAAGPPDKLTDSEKRAAWSEMSAFNFMPSTDPGRSVWETYFAPSMTATNQDGTGLHP